MYSHIYEPRALLEYLEALNWYSERSITAAENFEKMLNDKLLNICVDPLIYKIVKKPFKEVSLKKYPYSIIFFVEEESRTVVIVSIFHQSRNPKVKYKR